MLYPIARRHRARPPPHQLGGGGARLGRRDAAAAQGGLVAPGRWEDLGPHLKRFRLPYCDVTHLIEATGEFWEYPMCDRDPLPRWSHGRVTLLGDAAHPMYPVGSNGASQAILDARCLADLARARRASAARARGLEAERLPPTAQIVRMNRKGGPEGVIDAVEALAPDGFTNIDDVMSYEQRMAIVRGYASTAGFARESR